MIYFKYTSLIASLAFFGLAGLAFFQPQLKTSYLLAVTITTLIFAALSDLAGLMLKDRQNRILLEFIPFLLSLSAAAALAFMPLKNQTVLLMTVLALWLLSSAVLQFVLAQNLPQGPGERSQWRRVRGLVSGLLGFLLLLYPVFPKHWTILLLVAAFLGEGLLSAQRFYRLNKLF